MSRPDALLMLADIARLTFEHTDVDETLIRAIYQHQVLTTGRQPTLRQAREYIGHLTSRRIASLHANFAAVTRAATRKNATHDRCFPRVKNRGSKPEITATAQTT